MWRQTEMGLGRPETSGSVDPRDTTGEVGRTTAAEPSGSRRFPLAAQPEIMRAAEKDDQYASHVYEACRDAFRHLFGLFYSVPKFRVFLIYIFFCLNFHFTSIFWFRLFRGNISEIFSSLLRLHIGRFSRTFFFLEKIFLEINLYDRWSFILFQNL